MIKNDKNLNKTQILSMINYCLKMARGQQKLQSQAKAAEKLSKLKKQQGHSATDQKKAAQKALVHVCVICKVKINVFMTNISHC